MKLALVNSIKGQINSVSATHASYLQSFSKTFMCILNKMTANFYSVTVLAGCWGRGSTLVSWVIKFRISDYRDYLFFYRELSF